MLLKLLPLVTTAVKSVSQPEIEIGQMLEHCTDFDTSCHEVVVKLVHEEDTFICLNWFYLCFVLLDRCPYLLLVMPPTVSPGPILRGHPRS